MGFTKVIISGVLDTVRGLSVKFNSLIDGLLSTDSGKGASQIGVEDSAEKFTGTNVETVLTELANLDHTQGTDQKLDDGGDNEVTVANVKDAVDKKHTQDSDTILDDGETNEVTAGDLRGHLDSTANPHSVIASQVEIPDGVGTPSYDDVQDFLRTTRSSGRLTGGEISTYVSPPTPDGIVSISEMEGMIFTTNELGGTYIFFKQVAGTVNLTGLDDNKVYWIYYDWNSGTPQYAATSTRSDINEYDQFAVGRAWRSGNTIEVQTTGHNIYDRDRRAHNRLILKYGNMDRESGGILSAHATALRLTCSAGSWYVANYSYTTEIANTFNVWYKSGSATWVKSSEITLFSDIFNGASATVYESYQNGNDLGAITGNKTGVHWIFLCPEGDLYLLLGTASYTNIGAAQAATVPTSLPPYLVDWGRLIGRVICQEEGAALYSVESVFSTQFTLSATIDHNSTSGKQGGTTDEYYHTTSAENSALHAQDTDTDLGAVSTKDPPIDADKWLYRDSTASDALVTSTGTQVKAYLKSYFDGLYTGGVGGVTAAANLGDETLILGDGGAKGIKELALGGADLKLFMNAGNTAPEWAVGMKIGTFTKNTADETGPQEISGVGFKPSHIIFTAVINATDEISPIGFTDGTNHYSVMSRDGDAANTWGLNLTNCITLFQSTGIEYQGAVTTLGADGFTITWTKIGGKTGSAYIHYMAFR